jgi:hypothetical protein
MDTVAPNLSESDRDVHIKAVVKSNLVGFNLSSVEIDCVTENLTADLLDVLDNYKHLNAKQIFNGEF